MFEKLVMNILLRDGIEAPAEFCNGSLFIECEENVARSVFHSLRGVFGIDKIRISVLREDAEYVFDFVE